MASWSSAGLLLEFYWPPPGVLLASSWSPPGLLLEFSWPLFWPLRPLEEGSPGHLETVQLRPPGASLQDFWMSGNLDTVHYSTFAPTRSYHGNPDLEESMHQVS